MFTALLLLINIFFVFRYTKFLAKKQRDKKHFHQAKNIINEVIEKERIEIKLGITKPDLLENEKLITHYNQNIPIIKKKLENLNEVSLKMRNKEIAEWEWAIIFSSIALNEVFPYGAIPFMAMEMAEKITDETEKIDFLIKHLNYMHCEVYFSCAALLAKKIVPHKSDFCFKIDAGVMHIFGYTETEDISLMFDPTTNIFGIISKAKIHELKGNSFSNLFFLNSQNNNFNQPDKRYFNMNELQVIYAISLTGGSLNKKTKEKFFKFDRFKYKNKAFKEEFNREIL